MVLRSIRDYVFKYLSSYASEQSLDYFRELNVYKDKKLQYRMLFFLFITLLGYISVLLYRIPYHDDFVRYLYNYPCGSAIEGRVFSEFLERTIFLSGLSFDIAPVSQIISCILLAYATVIITKIFDNQNKKQYLFLFCFIPIAVNPYILETLLFRFDNIFMTGAFFCSVLAGYISTKDDKGSLLFQVLLLFYVLLTYQTAISAYLILFVLVMLKRFVKGGSICNIVCNMKYWIISILIAVLIYYPIFSSGISEIKLSHNQLILPYNWDNICKILQSFLACITKLFLDWGYTNYGLLLVLACFNILVFFLLQITKNQKLHYKILNTIFLIILSGATLVAVFGINIFVPNMLGNVSIRTISSIGIVISFILYVNYIIANSISNKLQVLITSLILTLSVWNIVIVNSFVNMLYVQYSLTQRIYYALGCDLDKIIHDYKGDKAYLHFSGISVAPELNNALNNYPMFRSFIVFNWYFYKVVMAASYCPALYKVMTNVSYKHYEPQITEKHIFNNNDNKQEILKQSVWYDIFIVNGNIIEVKFKHGDILSPILDDKRMISLTN